jgi:periplasmic protein TonB
MNRLRRLWAPDSGPIDMPPSDVRFKAIPALRLIEERRPTSPREARLYLALIGALAIHLGVLSLVYFENKFAPARAPETVEIPVEIVAEPPPPPPPPPPQEKPETPAEKQDSAQSIDEAPANDAPRAASKEKDDKKTPDQATKAPSDPTPPTSEPSPTGSPGAAPAGPAHEGQPEATKNAAEPTPDKPDAEVTKAVESELAKAEQQARADAQAQAPPQLAGTQMFPAWSMGRQSSNFEHLLESQLGSEAEETPVAGGNARATYFSILYGMIFPRFTHAVGRGPASQVGGVVAFGIDGKGNVRERRVVVSSGSTEVDSAALAAIAQASPFPPPPHGTPVKLTFTYTAGGN